MAIGDRNETLKIGKISRHGRNCIDPPALVKGAVEILPLPDLFGFGGLGLGSGGLSLAAGWWISAAWTCPRSICRTCRSPCGVVVHLVLHRLDSFFQLGFVFRIAGDDLHFLLKFGFQGCLGFSWPRRRCLSGYPRSTAASPGMTNRNQSLLSRFCECLAEMYLPELPFWSSADHPGSNPSAIGKKPWPGVGFRRRRGRSK